MTDTSSTSSTSSADADRTRKVAELLSDERQAMFTTTAPDGTLMSRPMAIQATDFDGDLWFFAERSSRKVAHLAAHPQVNVTVSSASTWVSLTGQARLVADDAKKRELWNPFVEAWFPDGRDDDGIVLITVEAGPRSTGTPPAAAWRRCWRSRRRS